MALNLYKLPEKNIFDPVLGKKIDANKNKMKQKLVKAQLKRGFFENWLTSSKLEMN